MQLSSEMRGLSPPVSDMDRLINNRERAEELVTRAVDMIAEANALTPSDDDRISRIGLASTLRSTDWLCVDDPNRRARLVQGCMHYFDKWAWMHLLKRSRMADLMSHKDKDEYYQQLEENPPAINRETVIGTFTELFGNRRETWRRGVVELFAGLSGNYSSHSAFRIGKRLVIEYALSGFGWGAYRHADDKVDDLQRVIALIRGEPQPESRLSNRILDARKAGEWTLEAGPLLFRWFKNQNLHIWINDPTLLDQINEIIAEHYGTTLPDDRGAS